MCAKLYTHISADKNAMRACLIVVISPYRKCMESSLRTKEAYRWGSPSQPSTFRSCNGCGLYFSSTMLKTDRTLPLSFHDDHGRVRTADFPCSTECKTGALTTKPHDRTKGTGV